MTARISRQHWRRFSWITLVIGSLLVVAGFAMLPVTLAQTDAEATPQPTRFGSMFDSAAPATSAPASPVAVDETDDAPATEPPATATTVRATVTPLAQPTRIQSLFDPPGQSAPVAQPTQPDNTGDTGAADEPATPAQQPTRMGSIFDAPASSGGQTGSPAQQPTRMGSIFDAPAQQPTRMGSIFDAPAQQPTRMGSIFDSAGTAATPIPQTGIGGQTGSVGSIFDTMASDVIRYQGSEQPDAEYCLSCHASEFLSMELPNGEVISVTVDEEAYFSSVHGQHGTDGYRCVRCHVGMNEYPHEEIAAQSSRELVIDLSTSCATCHVAEYTELQDDLHVDVLARGNINGATCADCHTGHAVQRLSDETTNEPLPGSAAAGAQMCSSCHSEVYASYAESVHGKSVLSGNNDAATCSDCHGVHHTEGPSTGPFRLFSPQTCATCHADDTLMAKYDISTDVFDTYLADFHGSTVAIFQQTAPEQDFNAPVCADCHGIHDIMAVDSADSPVLKENLVGTCQQCHPGATTNFPDAWMSHYQPTLERTPIVTVANLAYAVLIPAVIGSMALFVASDVRRRRAGRHDELTVEPADEPAAEPTDEHEEE